MKIFSNTLLFLLIILLFENNAYSLSDYQIKEICQKKAKKFSCIKNLRLKKIQLLNGNKIEVPVVPFKK